jgi:xanthine dehydrogenase accessory factor
MNIMDNLRSIVDAYQNSRQKNEKIFLATIVQTQGSTYRKAGARMLVAENGSLTGTISGGCLEWDILCRIRQETNLDRPFIVPYDTSTDEDIVWGFGLGCNGSVKVLIESLTADDLYNPLSFIVACLDRGQLGILATVCGTEGNVNIAIGTRLLMSADGFTRSNIEDEVLERAIALDCQTALAQKLSQYHQYSIDSGLVEVSIEVIQPQTPLIIFGAGRDALPLAQFAQILGWHLTIVDCRSNETTGERFPMANRVLLSRREIVGAQVSITENTAVAVMTHNYYDDLAILTMLSSSPPRYIGVLGSRQRTIKLLAELQGQGIIIQPERLHAPIGLDIGATTPEAIAIAIVAEIHAVLSHRTGGFLNQL